MIRYAKKKKEQNSVIHSQVKNQTIETNPEMTDDKLAGKDIKTAIINNIFKDLKKNKNIMRG